MILPDFKAFPRDGRIIGVDWGRCRTGLAVCDETREFFFVRPAIVLPRGGDMARAVAAAAGEARAIGIVVGLPLRGDGGESDTTAAVREFASDLAKITDLPICFINEELSSAAAQENIGRTRVADLKRRLDSESARVILENAVALMRRTNA